MKNEKEPSLNLKKSLSAAVEQMAKFLRAELHNPPQIITKRKKVSRFKSKESLSLANKIEQVAHLLRKTRPPK